MAGSKKLKRLRSFEPLLAGLLVALLSAAAVWYFSHQGYLLYYGDAQAHLNIARRVIDSRTPGYFQFGTVWLPLPHLLILPFVGNDEWWRSGLAGVIPAACCFVLASAFLFAAARRALGSSAAGTACVATFALNPNVLYLQSIAMTEVVFFAAASALLYFTVRFRDTQSIPCVVGAALAALAATLTRYEGWFLIPFTALYFLAAARRGRFLVAVLFGVVASLGPLYWLAHNWWFYGDFLEFYRGPYSAQAIYRWALEGGMARYPGDHDWAKAWQYFREAARLCAGPVLFWAGTVGVLAALWKRAFWPLLLLTLPPAFYVWSIHSGSTPVFVPHFWPFSYYNTRYGLSLLPALAFAAAALVALTPERLKTAACLVLIGTAVWPWVRSPGPESWICWKESEVNSKIRREWTKEAAGFLGGRYRTGAGIFMPFGDLTGILLEAGIPIRESLYDGNVPLWDAVLARPDLFLREEWAVSLSGDPASVALMRANRGGRRYECVKTISVRGGPVVQLYRRVGMYSFEQESGREDAVRSAP